MRETFVLPNLDPLSEIASASTDKIIVISIIGKSCLGTNGLKLKSIGRMFASSSFDIEQINIEGYYDEENQILYLHVISLLDSDILIKHYQNLVDGAVEDDDFKDFLAINDEIKNKCVKVFLFLLHLSHIIILSHPSSTFDTSYIQSFKALLVLSQKLTTKLQKYLEKVEKISEDWLNYGRPCLPRMLFYFERAPKGVNIKRMEHNLEDKIYHILKKTKIIMSPSSLFAIPLNQEFVYMSSEKPTNKLGNAINGLIKDCQPGGAMQVIPSFSKDIHSERSFHSFLQVHIKQARSKGFNDTIMSRNIVFTPTPFELPILKVWIDVAKIMYERVINKKIPTNLNTDTKFSEQRCWKVLPLALAQYQENLPTHYGKAVHDARLAVAFNLFRTQARGPMFRRYAVQLKEECLAYWEKGRQQCEEASMMGNPCKLPKHGSEQPHISDFVYKAVCDCGRKIGFRDDPYDALQANQLFYEKMAKECQCGKLERIVFPIFEPSTEEYKAATLNETSEETTLILSDRTSTPEPDKKEIIRQPSTTEYLPGMLTLSSPSGLLPTFTSWSLVCLGASSLYSHNLGLSESHHPGFLSSTNYLLPWDVVIYSKSATKNWPGPSKYSRGGRRGRGTPVFTVKVFIGVEYECPSGHRFMLSAPDKMLKATPGSMVKDTGHKIAESDMPLNFPCVCRAGKMAQLMRLHVVTPKAPVSCTLNPKIQPAANSPIFVPTSDGPIKLSQSSYWLMRLPYVFVADKWYPQIGRAHV